MRLRVSNMDLRNQMDAIIALINCSKDSLLDLGLRDCNLNLNNFNELSACLRKLGQEAVDLGN